MRTLCFVTEKMLISCHHYESPNNVVISLDHPPTDHNGCHYRWRWETISACPNASFPSILDVNGCKIFHPTKQSFSLHNLRLAQDYQLPKTKSKNLNQTYYIQPCGSSTHCQGTLCVKNAKDSKAKSLGSLNSSQFFLDEKELRVLYKSTVTCNDLKWMKYSAEIHFVCDENAKEAKIELLQELPCHPIFKWLTSKICPAFISSRPMIHPYIGGSSSSSFWTLSIVFILALIVIAMVMKKPFYRERAKDAFVWMKIKLFHRRREDTNLLVDSNVIIPAFGTLEVDDDEDLIIA